MLNPTILEKLKGKIAIIEYQPDSRQTPELITGVIADLYLNNSVVAVIIPKSSNRIFPGQTPQVSIPDVSPAPANAFNGITPSSAVRPPAPTISNVDPTAIKREFFTDLHIRFFSTEAVNSVEYFSGVRYDLTRNSVLNKVQPERLFDGIETDSVVDKLTATKNEDGTWNYQWSKRKITEASKAATHNFCVEDVMKSLVELEIKKVIECKKFDPTALFSDYVTPIPSPEPEPTPAPEAAPPAEPERPNA